MALIAGSMPGPLTNLRNCSGRLRPMRQAGSRPWRVGPVQPNCLNNYETISPKMKFTDGVEFNLEGPLRVESRSDGLYVVGRGMLVPVESMGEARSLIAELAQAGDKYGSSP